MCKFPGNKTETRQPEIVRCPDQRMTPREPRGIDRSNTVAVVGNSLTRWLEHNTLGLQYKVTVTAARWRGCPVIPPRSIAMQLSTLPVIPSELRGLFRKGEVVRPTGGMAPGRVQANLAILPRDMAFDF